MKIVSLCLIACWLGSAPLWAQRLAVPGGTLYGKLTTPKDDTFRDVVLFIGGSGPVDHNGNVGEAIRTNNLKMLADSLAARGIASLRYDKRGVGKSRFPRLKEEFVTIDTLVLDVVAWVAHLRAQYPDSVRIHLLGHSEGSLLAALAAQKIAVDKVISVAGAGRPAQELIAAQLAQQPLPLSLRTEAFAALDSLSHGKRVAKVDPLLQPLFRQSAQPYLLSWFRYDPRTVYAKLPNDVLFLHGDQDLQVPLEDFTALSGSHPHKAVIPHMNHVLKHVASAEENTDAYVNPRYEIPGAFVTAIVAFL